MPKTLKISPPLLILSLCLLIGSATAFRITLIEEQPNGQFALEFESSTNRYYMLHLGISADTITNQLAVAMGTNGIDRLENLDGNSLRGYLRMAAFTFDQPDDSDGDGLADAVESNLLGTDPNNPDSDFDQLSDGDEFARGTDLLNSDSDADGFADIDEVTLQTDPLDDQSYPSNHAHSESVAYTHIEPLSQPGSVSVVSSVTAYTNEQNPKPTNTTWVAMQPVSYLNQRIPATPGDLLHTSTIASYLNATVSEHTTDLRAHADFVTYLNVQVRETDPARKSYSDTITYINAVTENTTPISHAQSDMTSYLNAVVQPAEQINGQSSLISYQNNP